MAEVDSLARALDRAFPGPDAVHDEITAARQAVQATARSRS